MILKIQRPLSSNAEDPPCLVYNKSRTVCFETPMTEAVMSWFDEGELKVYVKAKYQAHKNHMKIFRKLKNHPDW